jgi:hypothetical protein
LLLFERLVIQSIPTEQHRLLPLKHKGSTRARTMSAPDDGNGWQPLREMRHNPCLMSPVSLGMLFILLLVWIITTALRLPAIVLGFLTAPLVRRFPFVIEFLYPTGLGKWVHFFIIRMVERATNKHKSGDMNRGYHSRALEQRVEVCKGRLFVHALPQLMDNLGYLVVCCPEEKSTKAMVVTHSNSPKERISVTTDEKHQIVAFVVDCGDADEVAAQVELISERHYGGKSIEIQSILSTHKHHDHTAGNKGLLSHESGIGESIKTVFGGAVEKVPHCNFPVVNGEMLPLPRYGDNEMGAIAQVEVIATPAHTSKS